MSEWLLLQAIQFFEQEFGVDLGKQYADSEKLAAAIANSRLVKAEIQFTCCPFSQRRRQRMQQSFCGGGRAGELTFLEETMIFRKPSPARVEGFAPLDGMRL
ncbi:MAG TPA: hypothetical protein PLD20_28760 [Blastocatellia bacterium]|nr:hypothetical protein [Blastocatellia bacterium]HMV84799.1 hypothetical protein [Blastocatellia bacterium]HMZ21959.1 hypothetical protein [Blastocatellia bacterium]